MRKFFLVATAAVSMFAMGCPSPESVCQTKAETACKKIFECTPESVKGTNEFKATVGATEAECQTKQETQLKCGTIENYDELCTGTDSGKEYQLGKASDCSDQVLEMACEDFMSNKRPAVCAEVCK
ncbi:hypothetical protein JQX13_14175 [Archangium violaceum]|uniref:hypothetical protein n=1 Tax=Archangium violaceum TaxID=83451 RepID=UPI00193C1602|nr:hypothetical protein [Archangium violaceum]QRK11111.1 hypothetical protein JQX13_14175 [Archangium violaceum]